MKACRAEVTERDVQASSDAMRGHLLDINPLCDAERVFIYVSSRNEPDTHSLIQHLLDQGKRVSVPRIGPEGLMRAHVIQSMDDLQPGGPDQFKLRVPPVDAPVENEPQVMIVPGLAFTRTGQRLGMGGGYYDRYLADHPETFSIGLCYGWQLVDDLPTEPHDQQVRMLATESGVVSCD